MKYNNIGKKEVIDFVEDEESYQALVRMSERVFKIDSESQHCAETKLFLFAVDQMREANKALHLALKELRPFWIITEKIEDNYEDLSKYTTERSYQDLLKANNCEPKMKFQDMKLNDGK